MRATTGVLTLLALVGLPVELTITLSEQQPVLAASPLASVLLAGSCLLLVRSGLELRRLAAAQAGPPPPVPGL